MRNRIRVIDVLNFYLSLGVVCLHSYNPQWRWGASGCNTVNYIIPAFSHGLCTAAVPIFFSISGYLFFRNIDSLSLIYQKQTKRIRTVLIPFLVWSSIYMILFCSLSYLGFSTARIPSSIIEFICSIVFYKYCFPLWFMFQLIIYVIIAPVTYAFARKPLLVFTYLVILVMGALGGSKLVWMIDLKSIMCERGMFYFNYYAYYLLGAAIALNCNFLATFKRIVAKFTIKAPIIAAVLLVISFLSSLVFEDIIRTPYHRIMIPFVAVGVLLFVAKMKDALRIPLGVSPVLIYCIHPMIGVLFSVLLPPLPMVCVDYMARCVLICGFSCLSVYCLQKYCPRWCYKILSGDR